MSLLMSLAERGVRRNVPEQVNKVFFVAADGNQLATVFCDRKAFALQGYVVLNEVFLYT